MADLTPAEQAARDQALAELDDPATALYPWTTYGVQYSRDRGYEVTRTHVEVVETFGSYDEAIAFAEAQP